MAVKVRFDARTEGTVENGKWSVPSRPGLEGYLNATRPKLGGYNSYEPNPDATVAQAGIKLLGYGEITEGGGPMGYPETSVA